MEKEGLDVKKSQYKQVSKDSGTNEKYKTTLEDSDGFQIVLKSEEPIELPEGVLKVLIEEGSLSKKDRILNKLKQEVG